MENFYSGKGAEVGPYLEVIFDGEEVSLDIPMEGINLPSGWSLQPLVYPMKVCVYVWGEVFLHFVVFPLQLLRVSVDNYQPGHSIPACQVQLVWLKVEELPKELSYMIHITGVIPHDTHIRVTRSAVAQGQQNACHVWLQINPHNTGCVHYYGVFSHFQISTCFFKLSNEKATQ